MAADVRNRARVVQGPFLNPVDFTFTEMGSDVVISYDMNVASRSISILARSIYIPEGVTITGREIQLLVHGTTTSSNITCLGRLVCARFRTNTTNVIGVTLAPIDEETPVYYLHRNDGEMVIVPQVNDP